MKRKSSGKLLPSKLFLNFERISQKSSGDIYLALYILKPVIPTLSNSVKKSAILCLT